MTSVGRPSGPAPAHGRGDGSGVLLVTGATGAIGCTLVEELAGTRPLRLLVRRDDKSTGRERLLGLLEGRAASALRSGEIEVFEGDLAKADLGMDATARRRLKSGLTGVVHSAARTDFQGSLLEEYRPVNVDGALRMAALAVEANCPLFLLSTAHVSGKHSGTFREDDLSLGQGHHNPYEESKQEAEARVTALAKQTGLPVAIFRPGIVLPGTPRPGIPIGPGPLVYLRYLAGLRGTDSKMVREIRYAGDPQGVLNLVPLPFVVRTLAEAVKRPVSGIRTYHLTAGQPFTMERMASVMNDQLTGLRVVVRPPDDLEDLDRYETILAHRCRFYQPYLFLRTRHDRSHLLQEFCGDDGADDAWLGRVYEEHLRVWRSERQGAVTSAPRAGSAIRYFDEFLAGKVSLLLVPGLKSLSAEFTVSITSVARYYLRIVHGVLESVERAPQPSTSFDYEIDAPTFLEAVTARVKPAQLFFDNRIRIRGNLYNALSTATALEDFFRLYPFSVKPTEALT